MYPNEWKQVLLAREGFKQPLLPVSFEDACIALGDVARQPPKVLKEEDLVPCNRCGKEANVYHAVGPEGNDMAVKVFKTSILVFRDRDRYVTGDWRFRRGYCKSNPRKMVKLWAEKETRNLIRLAAAGIPCPTPIQLRLHVLVMSFIGRDGYAAPRLKVRRVSARCSLLSSLPYYDDFTDFTTLSPSSFAARMQTYPRPSVERFTESS